MNFHYLRIFVTTPEPTALTDAYAVMKAYSMYSEKKNLHLVVNRVYEANESKDVTEKLRKTAEKFLNMPVKSQMAASLMVITTSPRKAPCMVI